MGGIPFESSPRLISSTQDCGESRVGLYIAGELWMRHDWVLK